MISDRLAMNKSPIILYSTLIKTRLNLNRLKIVSVKYLTRNKISYGLSLSLC